MKSYHCKRCSFKGTRYQVRKHLRDEHMINKKGIGKISENIGSHTLGKKGVEK